MLACLLAAAAAQCAPCNTRLLLVTASPPAELENSPLLASAARGGTTVRAYHFGEPLEERGARKRPELVSRVPSVQPCAVSPACGGALLDLDAIYPWAASFGAFGAQLDTSHLFSRESARQQEATGAALRLRARRSFFKVLALRHTVVDEPSPAARAVPVIIWADASARLAGDAGAAFSAFMARYDVAVGYRYARRAPRAGTCGPKLQHAKPPAPLLFEPDLPLTDVIALRVGDAAAAGARAGADGGAAARRPPFAQARAWAQRERAEALVVAWAARFATRGAARASCLSDACVYDSILRRGVRGAEAAPPPAADDLGVCVRSGRARCEPAADGVAAALLPPARLESLVTGTPRENASDLERVSAALRLERWLSAYLRRPAAAPALAEGWLATCARPSADELGGGVYGGVEGSGGRVCPREAPAASPFHLDDYFALAAPPAHSPRGARAARAAVGSRSRPAARHAWVGAPARAAAGLRSVNPELRGSALSYAELNRSLPGGPASTASLRECGADADAERLRLQLRVLGVCACQLPPAVGGRLTAAQSADRRVARRFVMPAKSGLGSELSALPKALGWAFSRGAAFLDPELKRPDCEGSPLSGCLGLLPVDGCDPGVEPFVAREARARRSAGLPRARGDTHAFARSKPARSTVPDAYAHRGVFWWTSAMLGQLLRPAPPLREHLRELRAGWGWTPARRVLGLHVRRGDICALSDGTDLAHEQQRTGRTCDGLAQYAPAVREMVRAHALDAVFLATDDDAVVREARAHAPTLLGVARTAVYVVAANRSALYGTGTYYDRALKAGMIDAAADARAFLVDLMLLAEADAFVGKFTSNIARIAFALSNARKGGDCVVPFYSLDATWCADAGKKRAGWSIYGTFTC